MQKIFTKVCTDVTAGQMKRSKIIIYRQIVPVFIENLVESAKISFCWKVKTFDKENKDIF